jgi:hypothetical protein
MEDNCGDSCIGGERYCYSNPTCTARCVDSGYKHFASEPDVSTGIEDTGKYIYSDCDDDQSCYLCYAGCGECSGGTYSATQPANTYIPSECTYTTTTCDTSQKNCYYACPEVTCADLPSELGEGAWLDTCPAGQTCNETTRSVPIPIPTDPAPMAGKPYNCSQAETKTCYYPNNRPDLDELNIVALPGIWSISSVNKEERSPLLSRLVSKVRAQAQDSILGFKSSTHTGKELNNPIKVEGTYTDADGSDDIMALYVWWSPQSPKTFTTPTNLNNTLTGRTANNENFGILISRSYDTGNWEKVYIPHIEGATKSWTEAGNVGGSMTIQGPTPEGMIEIYDINISENGNQVNLDILMDFLNEDDSAIDIVDTNKYNLWGSVNDKAGYLPFPDYPYANEIVDSEDEYWIDPGNDWDLDMIEPIADSPTTSNTNPQEITVDVNVSDDGALSHVRLDACKTGIGIDDLSYFDPDFSGGQWRTYNLRDCDIATDEYGNFIFANITSGDSLLGYVGGYDSTTLGVTNFNEPSVIRLNGNDEGEITFYVTAMDMAGNNNAQSQAVHIERIEQWAVVEDGLVFGRLGVSSSTKDVNNNSAWIGTKLDSYIPGDIDLTNHILLGGNGVNLATALRHLKNNWAYKVTNYPGIPITSPYAELREAYELKSSNSAFEEDQLLIGTLPSNSSLSDPDGDGTANCIAQYCIWIWEADPANPTVPLAISNGFKCDAKGLIIVNGDLSIEPDFTNENQEDACIILVNGNITIERTGNSPTAPSATTYDTVEAFLIANGYIEIIGEGVAEPSDMGLFVQGGLVGFTPSVSGVSSVWNKREIHYSNMALFPVLFVQGDSKYGLLSRTLFGSQIDIFKKEVGFKPY